MAGFNEILVGRFNRALQKLTAIKGGPPARSLASEISSNIQFNAMGVDFRYLEGWNRYWTGSGGIVGLAGNSPTARIVNPIGSNVAVVVEKLALGTVAATVIDIQFETNSPAGDLGDLGSVLVGISMDARQQSRLPLSQQSVARVSTNTNTATVGQLVSKRQTLALTDFDLIVHEDQQILLMPASVLNFFAEAAASTMFMSIMWRERFLEDSERT